MIMSEQLLKAAVRVEELQDILGRRIEVKLQVGGFNIVVADHGLLRRTCTMPFRDLQTYSDNGLLADAIEHCVRRCDRELKAGED